MGCLNSEGKFAHWFANIHLSGPCNRSCYFCIGQHMMALDSLNNLNSYPLNGFEDFMRECVKHPIKEICVTGTNTDPLLYKHTTRLLRQCREWYPHGKFAIRTNGVAYNAEIFALYDKASITICSLDPDIYRTMMGQGRPPDIERILDENSRMDIKVNVVLGPENVPNRDLIITLSNLAKWGVERVNLREPYGQPHIGDPLASYGLEAHDHILGMPIYTLYGMEVTYWDVHYVEVESVNLYANGRVSVTYPISKGHDETGEVHDQSHFLGGRIRNQWIK